MILDGLSIDKVNMQNLILGRVSLEKKFNFPPLVGIFGKTLLIYPKIVAKCRLDMVCDIYSPNGLSDCAHIRHACLY